MRVAFPALLADIGGTNVRFAMLARANAPLSDCLRFETGGVPDCAAAVQMACRKAGWPMPASLLLGAAGAISGRSVRLTNAAWVIDGPALAQRLGLRQGLLLNDFETLALALPALASDDLMPIGAGLSGHGTRLIVGPGTGLGVGALIRAGQTLMPVSSEGGHAALAAGSPAEHRLFARLAADGRSLSAESLLAGPALTRLRLAFDPACPPDAARPPAIVEAALEGDPACRQVIDLWLTLLARFCAGMALTFLATGGVFLAGGILPRLRSLIDAAAFRAAFEDNSAHAELLGRIPVQLVTAQEPGLIGLEALARAPERYLLDYAGRAWC
ncbi:MAG TPA: glucokinase [Beijerinckiaceae bacterium]|nr:glucokinase [Beijerinckiaceae bacterium]